LARGLGIKQPSVSSWAKVPSDRVLAVEALTGVSRATLRPDLYAGSEAIDEIEQARASEYLLLARLLRKAQDSAFLEQLAGLRGDASPMGMAHIELAEAARATTEPEASAEYFALFIGIGRGEILPYASYYLTGFLHERPLANLREDLASLGIERADGNFDPEDHLGLLLEVMGGFASGTFSADLATQKRFFDRHVSPWAERCLADIAVAPSASFYKAVASLGSRFIAIEREAFEIETQ
jgi:TorA maturation chaperone TorD